jgi:hypothetical protein
MAAAGQSVSQADLSLATRKHTNCLFAGMPASLIHAGIFYYFKGEMPLQQIADGNDHHRRNHLRENSVQVNIFHQDFEQEIINEKIGYKNKKIPEQLHPAPYIGFNKYYIFH